jgi:hypothetical protein
MSAPAIKGSTGVEYPISNTTQVFANAILKKTELGKQVLQLTTHQGKEVAQFVKDEIFPEIKKQCKALGLEVPQYCAQAQEASEAQQGALAAVVDWEAPETRNANWTDRYVTFETSLFPLIERSMVLRLGGIPRFVIAIHQFAVALLYTIAHQAALQSREIPTIQRGGGFFSSYEISKFLYNCNGTCPRKFGSFPSLQLAHYRFNICSEYSEPW